VYYKAALTASLNGITNYNELGTMLNVPNVSFSYMGIIYAYNGTPGEVSFGVIDFNNTILQSISLNIANIGTYNIDTNPAIVEFPFSISITTSSMRPLRIAIWGGSIDGSNYVNIRTIILGFK
jgi:hypothetical protein